MAKGNKGSISTYGLYDARFKISDTPAAAVKQEPWWGSKLPSNKSSGRAVKFKKVGKGY